jgi:DNA-binding transcriptional LysR family regulator
MEFRQLRSFQTVANLMSFNKAADRLHYAQSSISAQIHALEEELGVQLFDRLGKKVKLTETGEQLLGYANKILDLIDETSSGITADKQPAGSLTIRVPESFAVHRLPKVILEFHSRFPGVKLNFITCAHEGLEKDLRKGLTDLAFLLSESVSVPDLMVETLGFENIVLVAAPRHHLASRRTVHTRDLAGETVLLSRVDCSYRRTFEQLFDQEEVRGIRKLEFHSVEALKRCAMAGVGIAILPEIAVAEETAREELAILPWTEGGIEVALLMLRYRERWISPTLNAFMDITKKAMKRLYESNPAFSASREQNAHPSDRGAY